MNTQKTFETVPDSWHIRPRLEVAPDKLIGIEDALAPEGLGSFIIRGGMSEESIAALLSEVNNPFCVAWRDNHKSFFNKRGEVVQNHEVFALKLSLGDPSWVYRVPFMAGIAADVEDLIHNLSDRFAIAEEWTADEMSLHRYDVPDIGLGFHADNTCFDSFIVVVKIDGINEIAVRDQNGAVVVETMYPGDINIMRATGLHEIERDDKGRMINQCPDHQVQNLHTPTSTSFIVRANRSPHIPVPGFTYDNWVAPMI